MTAETREKIRAEAMRLMAESDSDRAKLGAMKVLLEMDRLNIAVTNLDVQIEKNEASRPDFAPTVVDIMREVERAEAAMRPTDRPIKTRHLPYVGPEDETDGQAGSGARG
jgi:hypothetical protein